MEVKKIFQYALQREYEGKQFFVQNAERMSHAAAVGAFKNLAIEEQKHIDFIKTLLETVDKEGSSGKLVDSDLGDVAFFSRRAISESLDQTVIEAMVPDLPVLRMAYLIERDFAEFYETAALKVEGELKKALSMLANWERGHERLFKMMHDKAFEVYAGMPWGG